MFRKLPSTYKKTFISKQLSYAISIRSLRPESYIQKNFVLILISKRIKIPYLSDQNLSSFDILNFMDIHCCLVLKTRSSFSSTKERLKFIKFKMSMIDKFSSQKKGIIVLLIRLWRIQFIELRDRMKIRYEIRNT